MSSLARAPALLALVLLTGCGHLISSQQEVELGRGVAEQIAQEYTLLPENHPVTQWARGMAQPLIRASAKFRDPQEIQGYKLQVIKDDDLVNAFAAPGGFLYLSTGLILAAESCAEIAGVLGHELAHVTERHSVVALEKGLAAQTLAELFLDEGVAKDAALIAWNFLQSTKFSRDDEAESDSVGLQIAYGGGYNPYGLADFFGKLGDGGMPEFFSSHPASKERARDVRKEIQRRFGPDAKRRDRECRNTKMSLAEVKRRLR